MIVVEKVLQDLFKTLPEVVTIDGSGHIQTFPVIFDFGTAEDLAILLKQEEKIYPLLWLESGFTERHNNQKNEVRVSLSFKIATYGLNSTLLNQQRLIGTVEQVLIPVMENVRKAFERANTINLIDNEWEVTKFYNYGGFRRQETGHVWDALRFDVDIIINGNCLRPFSYA